MSKRGYLIALALLSCAGVALGQSLAEPAPAASEDPNSQKLCKMVVTAERGSKPFEMCMTKAEWAAKAIADAKDPNRLICQYEEVPGTRVRNRKVCLTAAVWEQRRLDDRQAIEKIQSQVCVAGGGC